MNPFQGRLNRTTYLLVNLISLLFVIIFRRPDTKQYLEMHDLEALLILIFIAIPMVIWQFTTAARRLHDRDISGWYSLLVILPLVQLVLLFLPGTKGDNKFGREHTEQFDLRALIVSPSPTKT